MWSNEMGGNVAFVDELYVMPGARRRGIARGLFEFVERERLFGAVAVALEVSPGNEGAWKLYESLGFEKRPFASVVKRLAGI
jgi:ribosomal protein S18 acetylase RimI-like enzyme